MKQIRVNEKCNGCGLCVVNSTYLEEDDEGNARPIVGKAVTKSDIENVKKVVADCPVNALSIVEVGNTSLKGKAGAENVIATLKKQCDEFKVSRVKSSSVRLNTKDYYIPIPRSSEEYLRKYTSEGSAKSAAKSEFERLCYSESAYRPLIKKLFVEYKVNVLKPYYNCDNVPESAYYTYNQMIRKYLGDAYAELTDLLGEMALSSSWKNFEVYPKSEDWSIELLRAFDERSTCSGIISALKDLSHTSLNDYVSEMDFDYDEQYAGEGLFGKTKYKNMWYFSGFDSAVKSFMEDLKWAIDYRASDIEDDAVREINSALEELEKNVKKEFAEKIKEIETIVKDMK